LADTASTSFVVGQQLKVFNICPVQGKGRSKRGFV